MRASRAALRRAIVLGGDELPVPSKQRVGRHDGARQTTRAQIEPASLLLRLKVPMPPKIHSIRQIDPEEATDRVDFDQEQAATAD